MHFVTVATKIRENDLLFNAEEHVHEVMEDSMTVQMSWLFPVCCF